MWEYKDDGTLKQFTNPFGEYIILDYTDKSKTGDMQAFYIYYTIPKSDEVCIELVSHDWTNAGVKAIKIGGSGAPTGISLNKTPISIDDAVTKCSNRTKVVSGTVALIFYFETNDNCIHLPDHGDSLKCS